MNQVTPKPDEETLARWKKNFPSLYNGHIGGERIKQFTREVSTVLHRIANDNGDDREDIIIELDRLDTWLKDWVKTNKPNIDDYDSEGSQFFTAYRHYNALFAFLRDFI